MHFRNLIIIFSLVFILGSCSSSDETCNATYFGGQIINPRQNFVTLSKNDIIIDTLFLDKENNFLAQIDVEEEGLYSFKHSLEYQYVYIQPRDSILIRLNNWDFDESLVFSGRGSEKNNFLISLFLRNEKESLAFRPHYKLMNTEFEDKISASLSYNNNLYLQLKESGVIISKKFNELAEVAISYPIYKIKEMYSWRYSHRRNKEKNPPLEDSFFNHRKNIEFNNTSLSNFEPYYAYTSIYLYGLAMKKSENDKSKFTENHLEIIAENVKVEKMKNDLLYQAFYNDFRKSKGSCTLNEKGLQIFEENCTDEKLINRINSLASDCEMISTQNAIDNFKVLNIKKEELKINSIIRNKKTVIYFWSPNIINPYLLSKRVSALEEKFPDLLFVGINMHPTSTSDGMHKRIGNQYYLTDQSIGHRFIKSSEPRTILLDRKGIVSNSFTYLSSPYLEKQLAGL